MTSDACHANVWVVLGEDEECREESRDEEWTDRNEVRCHGAAGKRMHVVVCAVHVPPRATGIAWATQKGKP